MDARSATPPPTQPSEGDLLDVGVGVNLNAEVGVDAGLTVGPDLDLDAAWAAGLAGSGTLHIGVRNNGAGAGTEVVVDVQPSPGAHAAAQLAPGCEPDAAGVLGLVENLVGSLTCTLGQLTAGSTAAVDVPVQVGQPDQTATVVLRAGADVLRTAVVDLRPTG